ncbi:AAA-type ATPase lid domain-containing protein, partial [Achromobacter ruhlandii]
RLLRVLAEGSFYRVGGAQPVRVDVRIVAATHQPLEQRVEQGLFREDLFHRLNVIRLRLPPLRERVEDIPALANHFLTASARALGVPVKRLTPEALAVLTKFDFPGNVRQLENFCHWLTVMAPGQTVERADLPPEIRAMEHAPAAGTVSPRPPAGSPVPAIGTVVQHAPSIAPTDDGAPRNWQDSLLRDAQYRLERGEPAVMATLTRQFEKILLQSALDASRGRRVEAASRLGIGRNTITRKLRELGIEDE